MWVRVNVKFKAFKAPNRKKMYGRRARAVASREGREDMLPTHDSNSEDAEKYGKSAQSLPKWLIALAIASVMIWGIIWVTEGYPSATVRPLLDVDAIKLVSWPSFLSSFQEVGVIVLFKTFPPYLLLYLLPLLIVY